MESEAAWLALVSHVTGAGVVLLDAAGVPLSADDRALQLLGYGSVGDLTHAWSSVVAQAHEWCAAAGRGEQGGGVVELAADGAATTTQVRVIRGPRDGDGQDRYIALIGGSSGADAGPRLTSFARRLGHDLRGPLNAMVLNLDLMRISVEDGGDDEESLVKRQRYLANLQHEIDRMSEALTSAVEQAKKDVS